MTIRDSILVLVCAILLGGSPARLSAGDALAVAPPVATWTDWSATAKTPAYAKARADAPLYDDKALWPLLGRDEGYFKETWAKARLLTWAKPGENGEWTSATSWLDDGKPAAAAPDQDTDVLMPAAEKKYIISTPAGHVDCRHITLERGASLQGGDSHELHLFGNCWVKIGANLGINQTVPRGTRQTFHRNDHPLNRSSIGHPSGGEGNVDGHYIVVQKDKEGSVEYLGTHHAADKMFLKSGTTIVGPDSCLMSGGWNRPVVESPATLVLMSGACTGQRDFNDGRFCEDSLRVDGTLLVGSTERPLTRDAVLSLNFKDTAIYSKATGLHVGTGGKLAVTSKDPKAARLVLRWSGVEEGPVDRQGKTVYAGADVPRRISMRLLGTVVLDGVLFMDVDKAGIQLTDLAQKGPWKNVAFGANCGAEPAGLYAVAEARTVAKKKAKPEGADTAGAAAGKALYETQIWDSVRLLTWAKPGQDGDPELAANWLVGGKPAGSAPDRFCDLTLPEAAKAYTVGSDKTFNVSARHLSIGKNATLRSHQAIVYGNTWVKEGGCLATRAGLMLKGLNHCFLRDDNQPVMGADGQPAVAPKGLRLYELTVRKGYCGEPCSVEALGFIQVEDRFYFADPTANNCSARYGASQFIVGPGATLTWGQFGGDGGHRLSDMMGTLVLLSGSTFQRHGNRFQGGFDLTSGDWFPVTIQAGTPERPLTKDAVIGLSAVEDETQWSLLLRPTNTITVTSKDPTKARLVLRWHGHGSEALSKRGGKPKVVLGLFGDCKLDGVFFDNLGKGGIRLSDTATSKQWKNVSFGPACDGTGDALVSQAAVPKKD